MERYSGKDDASVAFDFISTSERGERTNNYDEECEYGKVYRTSNESLVSFMPNVVKQDDIVLSVAASGDQYLSSILYGALKADIFDINVFAYYYTILKIVCASVLSLEDFKSFIVGESFDSRFMEKELYDKVSPYLPKRVKDYYDYLYYMDRKSDCPCILKDMVYSNNLLPLYSRCPYLFDGDYQILQRLLQDKELPTFMLGDITKILPRLNSMYDSMIFSNIIDYTESDFEKNVYEDGLHHLNYDGTVQLGYLWGDIYREPNAYQDLEFDKYGIESKVFPVGNGAKENNNTVLLMRKK